MVTGALIIGLGAILLWRLVELERDVSVWLVIAFLLAVIGHELLAP